MINENNKKTKEVEMSLSFIKTILPISVFIIFILFSCTFLLFSKTIYADEYKKYAICYGEMTKLHKRTGLHERNRPLSIEMKEKVCKAYSKGEIDNYPGKGG
tara:strand:- start:293 stop:598 length:306 start_codon:yes stop_codon:yes gene_type:complete